MYLEHFGLNVNPFGLSPKLDFLYRSTAFEESMAHLIYGLDNSEALVAITGAIGTGKTMALQSFLSHLGDRYAFALVTNTRVNSVELLKLILEDLEVPFPSSVDKSDLLILFKDFLLTTSREGRKVLVAVDEAQNLSRDVLEEIRLLTNLGQGDGQPVQILLLGQPELEELLSRPDLAQLRQRIRVHYRFEPLDRNELQEYIDHRMNVAGCEHKVFEKDAVDRIFLLSGGVPRVVNTLAGEALLSAFVAGRGKVRAEDVEEKAEGFGVPEQRRDLPPPPPPPAPEPQAARPRPVEPVSEPAPAPRADPPAMAVRARRERRGFPAWAAVMIVLAALVGAWFFGLLDGVLSAAGPDTAAVDNRMDAAQTRAAAAAVSQDKVDATPDSAPAAAENSEEPAATSAAVRQQTSEPAGTAEAAEQAGTPATPAAAGPITFVPEDLAGPGFYLHISSFRTPERAANMVRRLDQRSIVAETRVETVRGVDWHRVYIGPLADREGARILANQLKDAGRISYYKIVRLEAAGA